MARRGRVVTVWHGDRVAEILQSELTRRLSAAAIVVQNHAKRLVGKEGTGVKGDGGGTQPTGPRNRKKLIYGAFPSRPGEPPRKQTGRLQSSIAHELRVRGLFGRGLLARVGTNVKYGRWLELGTRRMAPRPWLRRALDEMRGQIRTILSRTIRGGDRGR